MNCKYSKSLTENGFCRTTCMYCTAQQESTCKAKKTITKTNADRIRSMSDETLAQWTLDNAAFVCESDCTSYDPMGKYLGSKCDEDCLAHCIDWLRAKSEETT